MPVRNRFYLKKVILGLAYRLGVSFLLVLTTIFPPNIIFGQDRATTLPRSRPLPIARERGNDPYAQSDPVQRPTREQPRRFSLDSGERDGLEGFGGFAKQAEKVAPALASSTANTLPTPVPSATPVATNTPVPTATPVRTPSPIPSTTPIPTRTPTQGSGGNGGGGGNSDLAFINSLLGGAISQALSGAGLGNGLFGGGGFGGNSQGWGGPDSFGGTSSDQKYGDEIDYSQKLMEQSKNEQLPGSLQRKCENGKCEVGPGYFSDAPPGTLLGPGDYVGVAHGNGGQFGDGAYKAIAQKSGASYQAFDKGGAGSSQILSTLKKAGRGDEKNPLTGEKKNVVIFFNCHGGGDYLEGTGGGITGRDMANAVIAGGKETGNKDFSHISIVDGGCMPCRGNNMQSQFENAGAEKSFNYFSGASPNRYAYTSGGSGHLAQQILRGIAEKGGTGPVSILKSDFIKAVGRVGNGGYHYRLRPG